MGTGSERSDVPIRFCLCLPLLPGNGDRHLRSQSPFPSSLLPEDLVAPRVGHPLDISLGDGEY